MKPSKSITSRRNWSEPCFILNGTFINVCRSTASGSFHDQVKLVLSGRVSTAGALGTINAYVELSKLTIKRPDKNKAGVKWLITTGL